jgi:hypothetical protein
VSEPDLRKKVDTMNRYTLSDFKNLKPKTGCILNEGLDPGSIAGLGTPSKSSDDAIQRLNSGIPFFGIESNSTR